MMNAPRSQQARASMPGLEKAVQVQWAWAPPAVKVAEVSSQGIIKAHIYSIQEHTDVLGAADHPSACWAG